MLSREIVKDYQFLPVFFQIQRGSRVFGLLRLFNIGASGADIGLLLEYLSDDRRATAPPTAYDHDWFLGLRVGLNDASGTAVLAGAVVDSGGAGTIAIIEAERRVGERWKLEIEARLLGGVDADDRILGGVVRDSVITVRLARFL